MMRGAAWSDTTIPTGVTPSTPGLSTAARDRSATRMPTSALPVTTTSASVERPEPTIWAPTTLPVRVRRSSRGAPWPVRPSPVRVPSTRTSATVGSAAPSTRSPTSVPVTVDEESEPPASSTQHRPHPLDPLTWTPLTRGWAAPAASSPPPWLSETTRSRTSCFVPAERSGVGCGASTTPKPPPPSASTRPPVTASRSST